MIGGLALSASCFERPDWLALAERCADTVLDRLHDPDLGLQRIWDDGGAKIPAFLDDHAAWLCAMLDLHRAGGDERFIESAIATAERICRDFFDAELGSLFFTAGDDELYDLTSDFYERVNMADSDAQAADFFLSALRELTGSLQATSTLDGELADEETIRKLRSLGYIP